MLCRSTESNVLVSCCMNCMPHSEQQMQRLNQIIDADDKGGHHAAPPWNGESVHDRVRHRLEEEETTGPIAGPWMCERGIHPSDHL